MVAESSSGDIRERFDEDALDFSIEDGGGGASAKHGAEADRRHRPVAWIGGVAA
jgi:hypothetical protein